MKRMTFNSWIYYAFFCLEMLKICDGKFSAFFPNRYKHQLSNKRSTN